MDKIKAFFAQPVVRLVCVVLFVLSVGGLIIGGITQETLSGLLVAVAAGIAGIAGFLALVASVIKS